MLQPQTSNSSRDHQLVARQDLTPSVAILNLKVDKKEIEPGESMTLSFTIANQSTIVDSFWVSIIGIPSKWVKQEPVSDEPIRLEQQQKQDVKIIITPPREPESRPGKYLIKIQAVGDKAPAQVDIVSGELTVKEFYEFSCDLHSLQPRGVAQGIFEVAITNGSNTDLPIKIEAREVGRQSRRKCDYEFQPRRQVTIPAGQSRVINLIVQAKAWPVAETLTHDFVITTTCSNIEQKVEVEGSWEQSPPIFKLTLLPQRRESVGQGDFTVQVSNQSEVDLTLALAGQDEEQGCRYIFDSTEILVPAVSNEEIELTVRPATRLRRRDPKSYRFTITAQSVEVPNVRQTRDGEWIQLPSTFKWISVWRLLLTLLGVLIAIVVGLYFLLKPPPLVIKYFDASPAKVVLGDNQQIGITWWSGYQSVGLMTEIAQYIRGGVTRVIGGDSNEPANEEGAIVRWLRNKTEVRILVDQPEITPTEILTTTIRGTAVVTVTASSKIRIIVSNSEETVSTVIPIEVQTPTPTATPTLPPTPTPSPTVTPTNTPTPSPPSGTANKDLTMRVGPGEEYEAIGTLPTGQSVDLRGRNPENTWWQINTPDGKIAWIPSDPASITPSDADTVPVVQVATPTPTLTASPTPTATPTPFYYFEARLLQIQKNGSELLKCVELNWYVENVDQVYLGGLLDRSNFIEAEDDPTLLRVIGHGGHQDCYDDPSDDEIHDYRLQVVHKDGSICTLKRIFSEDEDLFENREEGNCEWAR